MTYRVKGAAFVMPPAASNPKGIAAVRGRMAVSARQEVFQVGYVTSVVAAAGCAIGSSTPDVHGIDVTIDYADPNPATGSDPMVTLRAQLKTCTKTPMPAPASRATTFSYVLKNKNLAKLNYDPPTEPKILILMLLPSEPVDWIGQQPVEEILRAKCFWVNLRGVRLSSPNLLSSTTVQVPTKNTFDDVALCDIMQTIRSGGIPR